MIVQLVTDYSDKIESALASNELDVLRELSMECERFLRANLPLDSGSDGELNALIPQLERLISLYQASINQVEGAKKEALDQLQALGRSRSNTHKYLDIAREFGV